MENIQIFYISFVLLFSILIGLVGLFAFYKNKHNLNFKLLITSGTLLFSIIIFYLNLLIFPWYTKNIDPLKGVSIIVILTGVVIFILTNWILLIKQLLERKAFSHTLKGSHKKEFFGI